MHASLLEGGNLSSLQLESVAYAAKRHAQRDRAGCTCGFFLGDGAGVGKGRQIAGMILNTTLCGAKPTTHHRKHVWVSASNDLRHDASRDLEAVGWREEDHGKPRDTNPDRTPARAPARARTRAPTLALALALTLARQAARHERLPL